MFKIFGIADNQEGSAIILSILVLVILSIVGFSASRISTTEMQIVRNDGTYQQRFYLAESGAVEAAQRLENETNLNNLRQYVPDFLNPPDANMRDVNSWDTGGANPTAVISTLVPNNALEVGVMKIRTAPGSSLRATGTQLHELALFGLLDRNGRGQLMVEIGYRKRY